MDGAVDGSQSSRRGRRIILLAAAANVAGAFLVSALQVWSGSVATPFEYIGRPALAFVVAGLLLSRRAWTRWPALVIAAGTAIWLLGSAAPSTLLTPDERVAVGAAGLLVFGAGLLPWHPTDAATFRRRGRVAGGREAAAS